MLSGLSSSPRNPPSDRGLILAGSLQEGGLRLDFGDILVPGEHLPAPHRNHTDYRQEYCPQQGGELDGVDL